jgi:hypothetical protein
MEERQKWGSQNERGKGGNNYWPFFALSFIECILITF